MGPAVEPTSSGRESHPLEFGGFRGALLRQLTHDVRAKVFLQLHVSERQPSQTCPYFHCFCFRRGSVAFSIGICTCTELDVSSVAVLRPSNRDDAGTRRFRLLCVALALSRLPPSRTAWPFLALVLGVAYKFAPRLSFRGATLSCAVLLLLDLMLMLFLFPAGLD